ncbi:hypothetical protein AB9P05_20290 [Roseivirga sp. BDSF3-8]|uniref:hypothetical protein n=1 Tax=Roseivirga sp. BDSF3-8 TaxID=3241598 RepID=UPI003531F2EA
MIDLLFKYQSLLRISLHHKYYTKGVSDQFKLVPVPTTSRMVEKTGLLIRNDNSGINILADLDRPEKMLFYLNEDRPLRFCFWLFTTNPYFTNFTNLPVEIGDKVLYFTNKEKKYDADKPTSLHNGEYVSEKDLVAVSSDPVSTFGFERSDSFDVKSNDGHITYEGLEGANVALTLSSSEASEGQYRIHGTAGEENFIYPGTNLTLKPLGLIEISIDGEMKEEVIKAISEEGTIPSHSFTVTFERRATYWKYLIVPRYSNGIKNTIIYSEEKEAVFEGPEEIVLHNGTTAWAFSSKEPIVLQDMPHCHFQLKRAGANGSGKVIVSRLPAPGIEMIKPETRKSDAKIYSEIIVFI